MESTDKSNAGKCKQIQMDTWAEILKNQLHSVLTICTQHGTCDTRSGDLVFFSAAFDEFSVFTKM